MLGRSRQKVHLAAEVFLSWAKAARECPGGGWGETCAWLQPSGRGRGRAEGQPSPGLSGEEGM